MPLSFIERNLLLHYLYTLFLLHFSRKKEIWNITIIAISRSPKILMKVGKDATPYWFSELSIPTSYFLTYITVTCTCRRPHKRHSSTVLKWTSMIFPLIAPPVSAATATPYPCTSTIDPNGITLGSTAMAIGF